MKRLTTPTYLQIFIIICALLTLILGLLTLLSLQPENLPLPQIEKTPIPMAKDAALGFLLAGIGLIAIFSNLKFLTLLSGLILLLLGTETIFLQFFPNHLSLIHFILANLIPQSSKLHHMELFAAILFIGIGILFWCVYYQPIFSKRAIIITTYIGAILFCFGTLHLFGYLIATDLLRQALPLFSPLSRYAALGFILMGLAISFYSVILAKKTTHNFGNSKIILFTIVAGVISLILWRGLFTKEYLMGQPLSHVSMVILKEIFLATIFALAVYYIQQTNTALKKLKRSYSLAKTTLETTAEGIFVVDTEGKIVTTNKRLLIMWNAPYHLSKVTDSKMVIDFTLAQLKNKADFEKSLIHLKQNPKETSIIELELKNGSIFEMYSIPQRLDNKLIGRVYSFHDITHLKDTENKLLYYATHDILTGLANRRVLLQRIQEAISRSKINNTHLAILFFDLDRFKLINDSLGHIIGDTLLKAISVRLRSSTRKQDTLARLGGDEFVTLITNLHDTAQIYSIVNRYIYAFSQAFQVEHHELFIRCSIGISIFPQHGELPEKLLERADLAMYRAKKTGTTSQFFSTEMHYEIIRQLTIENELPHALKKNQFLLYYQPIISLKKKKIISIEALIRWQHPQLGLQQPQNFIDIAEKIGLMPSIGDWALRTACHQFSQWHKAGIEVGENVCVNISESQLRQPYFASQLTHILKEISFNPTQLELELNETMFMDSPEQIIINVEEISKTGMHITLDDFGIGHSSLTLIKQLPIKKLKIDKSFVVSINENTNTKVIVKAIMMIARELHLTILAEGIETQEQLDAMINFGCDEIQGFFYSEPLSVGSYPEQIIEILEKISRL